MNVEVAYATPKSQVIIAVEVQENTTVLDAIIQSKIQDQFPEINLSQLKVGIFSRPVTVDTLLQAGDRVEIYRPLTIDPKKARLLRARKSKK